MVLEAKYRLQRQGLVKGKLTWSLTGVVSTEIGVNGDSAFEDEHMKTLLAGYHFCSEENGR
jgi:hypothetical protein